MEVRGLKMKREKGMSNFKMIKILFFIAGILLLAGESFGYVIDGDLSDWEVKPGYYNSSDWKPKEGVFWVFEDQTGGLREYLGPGYGGQFYDVEAIYFDYDSEYAYIAIVTGFCKSGRSWRGINIYPGDIALDFGADGSYEYGIITSSYRPSYALSEDVGGVYKVSSWAVAFEGVPDYQNCWRGKSDPTVIKQGDIIGETNQFFYGVNYQYYAGDNKWHHVIETSIPLDIFEDDWQLPLRIHWTITCGNDYLDLIVTPEPSSILLLSLGLFGLGGFLRKKYS